MPKARKKTPAKKTPARKAPAKKAAAKRSPAKKAAAKKSPARKAPAKKSGARKSSSSSKSSSRKRSPARKKAADQTAYDRRNEAAQHKGYGSYWDERKSRERAREALREIGHPNPDATDPATIRDIDELGTLGRGESARELYYKTKRILEKYQPAPSDSQIWALVRIFYKPRGRR